MPPTPSHLIVTRLEESSLPALVQIERESNRPPWSAPLFLSEFRAAYAEIYGVLDQNKVVAFLVCHIIFEEAHIANFAVRTTERGRGIGRLLLTSVIDLLRESNHSPKVTSVTLEVRRGNLAALSLYASLGFKEVGVRPKYYTDPVEDALILTAAL